MQVDDPHETWCEGERAGADDDQEGDVQSWRRVAGFASVHSEPPGWGVVPTFWASIRGLPSHYLFYALDALRCRDDPSVSRDS